MKKTLDFLSADQTIDASFEKYGNKAIEPSAVNFWKAQSSSFKFAETEIDKASFYV